MHQIYFLRSKVQASRIFQQAKHLKLKKKKTAVKEIETQIKSMEDFSSNSEFEFAKAMAQRMYQVDLHYNLNKAKFIYQTMAKAQSIQERKATTPSTSLCLSPRKFKKIIRCIVLNKSELRNTMSEIQRKMFSMILPNDNPSLTIKALCLYLTITGETTIHAFEDDDLATIDCEIYCQSNRPEASQITSLNTGIVGIKVFRMV